MASLALPRALPALLAGLVALVAAPAQAGTPAAFFYGDSTLDVGNNNGNPIALRANFLPYGVDFIPASGRFGNGKIFPDFLCDRLGIPYSPAFMDARFSNYSTGANFASGGAGALATTYNDTVITLPAQMGHFQRLLASGAIPAEAVRRGLHVISVGGNDYSAYCQNLTEQVPVPAFIGNVVGSILHAVQLIRAAGGTKFVVFNVPPLGCVPRLRWLMGIEDLTRCNEAANLLVAAHNLALEAALRQLQGQLGPHEAVIHFDLYRAIAHIVRSPQDYGFSAHTAACCGGPPPTNGLLQCGRPVSISWLTLNTTLCEDRPSAIWWDVFHPTAAVVELVHSWLWAHNTTFVKGHVSMAQLLELQPGGALEEQSSIGQPGQEGEVRASRKGLW